MAALSAPVIILCGLSAVAVFAYHWRRRGGRFLLNFLFFSFAFTFTRGKFPLFEYASAEKFGAAVIAHSLVTSLAVAAFTGFAWYLGERITGLFPSWKGRVFPALFFASAPCIVVSCALAPAAVHWIFLSLHFLCAYVLVALSPLKKRNAKFFLFLLPFAYMWAPLFAGTWIIPYWELCAILALAGLACKSPLPVEG